MAGTYEVFPSDDGWGWRLDDIEDRGYESRGEAYAAARAHRGDRSEPVYKQVDGEFVEVGVDEQRGPEAIVLLRPDGSVYGELSHAVGDSGATPQRVSIDYPGTTKDEVV